jgi:hypothetical protein
MTNTRSQFLTHLALWQLQNMTLAKHDDANMSTANMGWSIPHCWPNVEHMHAGPTLLVLQQTIIDGTVIPWTVGAMSHR